MKTGILFLSLFAASAGLCLAADNTAASRQIDAILAKEWKANNIQPNALASDETFLRRVYLDVIGRIPSCDEATAFMDCKAPSKQPFTVADKGQPFVQWFS